METSFSIDYSRDVRRFRGRIKRGDNPRHDAARTHRVTHKKI